jgi:hypothetical protein
MAGTSGSQLKETLAQEQPLVTGVGDVSVAPLKFESRKDRLVGWYIIVWRMFWDGIFDILSSLARGLSTGPDSSSVLETVW